MTSPDTRPPSATDRSAPSSAVRPISLAIPRAIDSETMINCWCLHDRRRKSRPRKIGMRSIEKYPPWRMKTTTGRLFGPAGVTFDFDRARGVRAVGQAADRRRSIDSAIRCSASMVFVTKSRRAASSGYVRSGRMSFIETVGVVALRSGQERCADDAEPGGDQQRQRDRHLENTIARRSRCRRRATPSLVPVPAIGQTATLAELRVPHAGRRRYLGKADQIDVGTMIALVERSVYWPALTRMADRLSHANPIAGGTAINASRNSMKIASMRPGWLSMRTLACSAARQHGSRWFAMLAGMSNTITADTCQSDSSGRCPRPASLVSACRPARRDRGWPVGIRERAGRQRATFPTEPLRVWFHS